MSKHRAFLKICAFVLVLTLVFSLCACKSDDEEGKIDSNKKKISSATESSNTEPTVELVDNPINFESCIQTYPNTIAWIKIPGIDEIDYPIMMSGIDMDDNFYIDHDIDGNASRAGAIYVQKHNSKTFDDPNTIIYGHNMGNGSMFGKLFDGSSKQFCNKDFFNEHRTIYIYIPGHILEYEIVSAFVYDDRHIINSFNFSIEEERMAFFNDCIDPPSFTKQVLDGATLDVDDKIITLSTCTSNPSERFLVIGKLINDTLTK